MKKKIIISKGIAALIAVSLLSGCGNVNSNVGGGASSSVETAESAGLAEPAGSSEPVNQDSTKDASSSLSQDSNDEDKEGNADTESKTESETESETKLDTLEDTGKQTGEQTEEQAGEQTEEQTDEKGDVVDDSGNASKEDTKEDIKDISDISSWKEGDIVHGFKLSSIKEVELLNGTQYDFIHEHSGAELVYIKNEDEELAFSISYKTPMANRADVNHVFEHSIIAGSEKYPAKDLFFDLANKSYSTFVNAFTYPIMTTYPISSMSEEQLIKMMDCYMSCMAAPLVIEDENIFKREAIRFELDTPEDEIEMLGTVFAEDSGFLTDPDRNLESAIINTLYPGEIASNFIGEAHLYYKDLTWDLAKETYQNYYHFDNSLISLYGNLDIGRFLEFLDNEYLSKEEKHGTDLKPFTDPETEKGFVEAEYVIPAYEGDSTENMSKISYAISKESFNEEEDFACEIISYALDMNSSYLNRVLKEEGIENPVNVSSEEGYAKNFFGFVMSYAVPEQKKELKNAAEKALKDVAENGIDKELLEALIKSQRRNAMLLRDSSNAGVDVIGLNALIWASGRGTDYYVKYNDALNAFEKDLEEQKLIKETAAKLLKPDRSTLVVCTPKEGEAEKHDKEIDDYLKEMKEGMTDEEIDKLIADTEAFREWNSEELPDNSFVIDPKKLPEYKVPGDVKISTVDGINIYEGNSDSKDIGFYRIYFDLGGMDKEKIEELMIYLSFGSELGSEKYSSSELDTLKLEYLDSPTAGLAYVEMRPMLRVSFRCLTDDFEAALELLLEMIMDKQLNNTEMISYIIKRGAESWNKAKQDGSNIAFTAAGSGEGYEADSRLLEWDVNGQDTYYLIKDMAEKLSDDPEYVSELAKHFEEARKLAFTKDNPIFFSVCSEEEQDAVKDAAVKTLNSLPEKELDGKDSGRNKNSAYKLPESLPKKTAILIEDSMQYAYLLGAASDVTGFKGRYIPWLYAANDKYLVPELRFRMGAYSGGAYYQSRRDLLTVYTYSDPNVSTSVDAMMNTGNIIESLEISDDELRGYILISYADATKSYGVLSDIMGRMEFELYGQDIKELEDLRNDIRNTSFDDKETASKSISEILGDGHLCMAGNEAAIRAEEKTFDEVISFK